MVLTLQLSSSAPYKTKNCMINYYAFYDYQYLFITNLEICI